ncbi:retrovirus-related pol polyprotein from transposon TNT 1-94, partial [Tanacetum coccineum]
TKKDKIWQTPSSTPKNKVEAHSRTVKSGLKNTNSVVKPKGTANVQHSKLNANSKSLCVKCNGCMLSDNYDLRVLDFIKNVNTGVKSKSVKKSSKRKVWKPTGKVFTNIEYTWRPTGRTFIIVENACPLTRITTTTKVPLRKLTALENETPKPVETLVYSRKPRKSKTNIPDSKSKVLKFVSANKKEPSQSRGSKVSNVLSSSLNECKSSKLFSVKFRNDHVAKILGYGDCQISKNKSYIPKSKDTNQEKLYLLHMDLCGPMRVASVNGKKYILVIVDDYPRFTWVKCLMSKDEALDFIIKFLMMIQKVGISHETSVARSPQQNGVVERRNSMLIKAARTMLIYAKALLFLCAEAVATACYIQNHSIIRLHHGKTPYELLHDKPPDLSFPHVFGTLCYPTNDSENLDAPSPSNSQTTPETQSPIIPNDVEEDNHDLDVAHMNNDPYFGIPIPEVPSDQSSLTDLNHINVHPDQQFSEHNRKWTKDYPLENIIGKLARPVSTNLSKLFSVTTMLSSLLLNPRRIKML